MGNGRKLAVVSDILDEVHAAISALSMLPTGHDLALDTLQESA